MRRMEGVGESLLPGVVDCSGKLRQSYRQFKALADIADVRQMLEGRTR
jgi:hypothetical protein